MILIELNTVKRIKEDQGGAGKDQEPQDGDLIKETRA